MRMFNISSGKSGLLFLLLVLLSELFLSQNAENALAIAVSVRSAAHR